MAKILTFDLETGNAGTEYGKAPHEFVRLAQWSHNGGKVSLKEIHTYEDAEFIRNLIREADYVVGHNIIAADMKWIFGVESIEPLMMAMQNKIIDTLVLAHLLTPAPYSYTNKKGHTFYDASEPGKAMAWLSLENLSHQFGLPGKFGSLFEIAKRYNPPKTRKADIDYALIPLDDEEFLEYAEADIPAAWALYQFLMGQVKSQGYPGKYLWRELKLAAITTQISNNGICIDKDKAEARVNDLKKRRDEVMAWLVEEFDFPTTGAQPWKSNAGKGAILAALESYGITFENNEKWKKTASGAPSFSGDVMLAITQGTPAEKLGQGLAELQGQRSLAQLALDSIKGDGKAHPDITAFQRSGRWSFTKPGLTVWTKNEEKSYIVADPGTLFAELDYSAADARAMAALSGDPEFAKRFATDENGEDLYDPHNLTGEVFFGADTYYGDGPRDKKARPVLREPSKAGGHSLSYNIGPWKLAIQLNEKCEELGIDQWFWAPHNPRSKHQYPIPHKEGEKDVTEMVKNFNDNFGWLKAFKDRAVREAEEVGYITNPWGRRMPVDEGREYNQGPALYGQSATRECMGDALIKLVERGEYFARCIKAIIHDALLVALDEKTAKEDVLVVKECMETVFDPGTPISQPIPFPVGMGPLASDWHACSH